MNRRKFLSNFLKGTTGAVATAIVGDKIIDALIPQKPTWETIVAEDMGGDNVKLGIIRNGEYTLIKGHQHLETGYIYAPYVPIYEDRYATKPVNPKFYGQIKIG